MKRGDIRLILAAVLLSFAALLCSCSGAANAIKCVPGETIAPTVPDSSAYTFAWMTDTQYYSESYPEIYTSMTSWIVANKDARGIKAVFHTGDVIDSYKKSKQWENAASAMSLLDGQLPYTVLAGNHDVGANNYAFDYTRFLAEYGMESPCGGQDAVLWYKDGQSRAMLLDAGETGYIILAVGWGADDDTVKWANDTLAEYSSRIAIVTTHDYLNANASISSRGSYLYENIVKPNQNVKLVLCGHKHGAGRSVVHIDDNGDGVPDRTVWQLIADYQTEKNGGNGFMRLLTIDEVNKTLSVTTYSPYIDSFNCFDAEADEFAFDISGWFD